MRIPSSVFTGTGSLKPVAPWRVCETRWKTKAKFQGAAQDGRGAHPSPGRDRAPGPRGPVAGAVGTDSVSGRWARRPVVHPALRLFRASAEHHVFGTHTLFLVPVPALLLCPLPRWDIWLPCPLFLCACVLVSVCLSLPPVPPPSHTHFLAQVTPPPAGFLLGPSTWPHARDRLLLALPLRTSPPPGILADLSRQKRTPCPRGRGALGCLSPAPGLGTPQDRGALPCLWAQPRVHCNTGVERRPRRRRPGRETGFSRLSQEQPHKRLRPRPSTRCHLPVPPAALAGVLGGPRAPGPSAGP